MANKNQLRWGRLIPGSNKRLEDEVPAPDYSTQLSDALNKVGAYSTGADNSFMSDSDLFDIQRYKQNWQDASSRGDSAGMAAAHDAAENLRAKYGYSGGQDGSGYFKTGNANDFPTYNSQYADIIKSLSGQIDSRPKFEYNPEEDSLYQQYAQMYGRNGQRAIDDTLAKISARTGGLASSYAGQASQQAYEAYMQQLNDILPTLENQAYGRYRDELGDIMDMLQMYRDMENLDYNRYRDDVSQYNADRNFEYNMQQDEYNKQQAAKKDAQERLYYLLAQQGGSLSDEGIADLITASGLTTPELNAYLKEYQTAQAEKAAAAAAKYSSSRDGNGGNGGDDNAPVTYDDIINSIPYGLDDNTAWMWIKQNYGDLTTTEINKIVGAYNDNEKAFSDSLQPVSRDEWEKARKDYKQGHSSDIGEYSSYNEYLNAFDEYKQYVIANRNK